MVKIHFVGGTGCGKTTLAQYAAQRTGLPLLPSASRSVMTSSPETKDMMSRIFSDLDAADTLQKLIWRQMLANEAAAVASHGGFVSDRSLDGLAYASNQSRVTWDIARTDEWQNYLASFHSKDRVVFFVRPEKEVVLKAKRDGVRDPWLSWECVNRIDGVIQYLLESNAIRHVPIRGPLRDRYRTVECVLAMAGVTK
jgi:predicted ATPase